VLGTQQADDSLMLNTHLSSDPTFYSQIVSEEKLQSSLCPQNSLYMNVHIWNSGIDKISMNSQKEKILWSSN
jgi:hypothetical protein